MMGKIHEIKYSDKCPLCGNRFYANIPMDLDVWTCHNGHKFKKIGSFIKLEEL